MTGAAAVAAFVGPGCYLRRTNEWCPTCGEGLAYERRRQAADLPRARTSSLHH